MYYWSTVTRDDPPSTTHDIESTDPYRRIIRQQALIRCCAKGTYGNLNTCTGLAPVPNTRSFGETTLAPGFEPGELDSQANALPLGLMN